MSKEKPELTILINEFVGEMSRSFPCLSEAEVRVYLSNSIQGEVFSRLNSHAKDFLRKIDNAELSDLFEILNHKPDLVAKSETKEDDAKKKEESKSDGRIGSPKRKSK